MNKQREIGDYLALAFREGQLELIGQIRHIMAKYDDDSEAIAAIKGWLNEVAKPKLDNLETK